jgi:hypothetical protein
MISICYIYVSVSVFMHGYDYFDVSIVAFHTAFISVFSSILVVLTRRSTYGFKVFKFATTCLVIYILYSYIFVMAVTYLYAKDFQSYIYFNDGFSAQSKPVEYYCTKNIFPTRPDRSFIYHFLLAGSGEVPIYFGYHSDGQNYYWSFKNWRFVSTSLSHYKIDLQVENCAN